MIVRAALLDDAGAVAAIYAHHVLHGAGTFEEVPPSAEEMRARMQAVLDRTLPWFVAEADGRLLAYAYAAPYRLRSAYRYTAEDSVYVAPDAMRRGAGRAVLQAVTDACAAMGLRQLVAVIGDSGNVGSVGLHAALGFDMVGTLPAAGYKLGRWLDVVIMSKALNGGGASEPRGGGIDL